MSEKVYSSKARSVQACCVITVNSRLYLCDGNGNPMINEAVNSLKSQWKWEGGKLITIKI